MNGQRMEEEHPESGPQAVAGELEAVRGKPAGVEEVHAKCEASLRRLRADNARLARLVEAWQRLGASLHREAVLAAIEGVLVELVGARALAVFDLDPVDGDVDALRLAHVHGVEVGSVRILRARSSFRYALDLGEPLVVCGRRAAAGDADGGLTAAIPLRIDGHVTGLVAVFGLRESKAALTKDDHQLFELLSRQAAIALHAGAVRAHRPTARPPRRG